MSVHIAPAALKRRGGALKFRAMFAEREIFV